MTEKKTVSQNSGLVQPSHLDSCPNGRKKRRKQKIPLLCWPPNILSKTWINILTNVLMMAFFECRVFFFFFFFLCIASSYRTTKGLLVNENRMGRIVCHLKYKGCFDISITTNFQIILIHRIRSVLFGLGSRRTYRFLMVHLFRAIDFVDCVFFGDRLSARRVLYLSGWQQPVEDVNFDLNVMWENCQ